MDGCGAEHPHAPALALLNLEPLRLYDDAEALDEEDAAEDGQQQLLVDDDGTHADDAADGQRTGVAHEHLCGVGVIPQEAHHSPHECREEHHQLFRPGNIHDVEVGRIDNVRRHVGEDEQCHPDDGRVAGTHAVHAVVEVGTVRHRRHHDDGHDDEEHPSGCHLVVAEECHDLRVVQVVVLDEGNSCLQRLDGFPLVLHHHLLVLALHGDVLAHHGIGAEPQRQSHDEAYRHLPHNLVDALQPLLVLAEYLDVVVHES